MQGRTDMGKQVFNKMKELIRGGSIIEHRNKETTYKDLDRSCCPLWSRKVDAERRQHPKTGGF